MNPAEVAQIVHKNWYSTTELAKFNDVENDPNHPYYPFQLLCSHPDDSNSYPTVIFPCGNTGSKSQNNKDPDTSMGSIEIKAAWMILCDPSSSDKSSSDKCPSSSLSSDKASQYYYTTHRKFNVKITDQESKPVTVPVALIGFHILQKTSATGWIWSTFEHIANAPGTGKSWDDSPCSQAKPQEDIYNIYNLNSNPSDTDNNHINQPAKSPYYWGDIFPYAVTTNGRLQSPSQITRQVCIPSYAATLNEHWQGALALEKNKNNDVLQNYQLIGVQWLATPTQPDGSAIEGNQLLINTAIEPFANTDNPVSSSCITCHKSARLPKNNAHSDFSFLMHRAQ